MRLAAGHIVLLFLLALVFGFSACQHKDANPVTTEDPTPVTPPVPEDATLSDFMPLSVDNQWTYHFYNFYRAPGGQIIDSSVGQTIWKVLSYSTANQDTTYLFEQTVNGVLVHKYDYGYASGSDTTFYVNAKYYFTITDSSNHKIGMHDTTNSPINYLAFFVQGWHPLRYGDSTTVSDTLTLGSADLNLVLANGIGILAFNERLIGNSQTIYHIYLVKWTIDGVSGPPQDDGTERAGLPNRSLKLTAPRAGFFVSSRVQ